MFDQDQYQLLDFGRGEKWERFGAITVQRHTSSVDFSLNRNPAMIQMLDVSSRLRFQAAEQSQRTGQWQGTVPAEWRIQHGQKIFSLKPTPAGQVGIFPEQATNWSWIEQLPHHLTGLRALNLFGYTGGTTLALAARGVSVVHVDSARNVMQWARQNATLSKMSERPIRWIVEDAMTFVRRESQRGSQYDILIADPPSYGTGPKQERWKFSEHIAMLFDCLRSVVAPRLRLLIFSCHTPGFNEHDLARSAHRSFDLSHGSGEKFALKLVAGDRRELNCGHCFRFVADEH